MVTVEGRTASFRFLRPSAGRVFLAGDFNGWKPGDLAMIREADGFWTATLRLAPGEYRFRYWADGQWFVDYAAFGVEHGPFGLDGMVRVAEAAGEPEDRLPSVVCQTCPHGAQAA